MAPELNDRILADFLEVDANVCVNLHIRSIDQNEAIKMIKRKLTDIDTMKIDNQKKAVREGFDMDIMPSRPQHLRRRSEKALERLTEPQRKKCFC